ncbi:MAG: hypothetical protein CL610_15845 [Anaerolineaceae bacterium]|nr:hypothetical protein [Anaerolineaceae bacterium]
MNGQLKISASFLLILSLLLASCASGAVSPGRIEMRITDHREAIGDFDRLDITIERVGVHPASAARTAGWMDFEPDTAAVDLTQVLDGRTAAILEAELPAGEYDAVRLHVASGAGDLKTGEAVTLPGFEQAVRVPFAVRADAVVGIVIDLIVESEDDHPGGGYEINILNAAVD